MDDGRSKDSTGLASPRTRKVRTLHKTIYLKNIFKKLVVHDCKVLIAGFNTENEKFEYAITWLDEV